MPGEGRAQVMAIPETLQVVGFQERKVLLVHPAARLFQKAAMPLSKSRLSLAAMHVESWKRK